MTPNPTAATFRGGPLDGLTIRLDEPLIDHLEIVEPPDADGMTAVWLYGLTSGMHPAVAPDGEPIGIPDRYRDEDEIGIYEAHGPEHRPAP